MNTSEVVSQYQVQYSTIAVHDTFIYPITGSGKLYVKIGTSSPQLFNTTDDVTADDSALGPTTVVLKRVVKIVPND